MIRFAIPLLALLAALPLALSQREDAVADGPISGPPGIIETYAGGGSSPEGSHRLDADIRPFQVAFSPSGSLYWSALVPHVVQMVVADNVVRVAGGGSTSGNDIGDGGPALNAKLRRPVKLDFDLEGDLVIADSFNCAIRHVAADSQIISTIAGMGPYYCGGTADDGVPATSTMMINPESVAVAPDGSFYFADTQTCRIRKVDAAGIVATVTGAISAPCSNTGDGGPAANARIQQPYDVDVAPNGDLYFIAGCNLRRIHNGIITTVAGNGGCAAFSSNERTPFRSLAEPRAIVVDSQYRIFIAEGNCSVIMLAEGIVTRVAGRGFQDSPLPICGFEGDGGAATLARLGASAGLAADAAGNLFIASYADDPNTSEGPGRIRVVYGAAADTDSDGYTDAAEAGIGIDHETYCATARADVNRDGRMNSGDLGRIASQWGTPEWPRLDQTGDGMINSGDLGQAASVFNAYVSACP